MDKRAKGDNYFVLFVNVTKDLIVLPLWIVKFSTVLPVSGSIQLLFLLGAHQLRWVLVSWTDRQTDRQTDKHADRWTDIQEVVFLIS